MSRMGFTGSTSSAAVQRYSIVLIETSELTVCALSGNMSENSSQPALTPCNEGFGSDGDGASAEDGMVELSLSDSDVSSDEG